MEGREGGGGERIEEGKYTPKPWLRDFDGWLTILTAG